MTEAEWLAATHPYEMLEFVKHTTTNRQSRLFACACCRHIWHLIDQAEFRDAVDTAELIGDERVIGKVRKSLAKRLNTIYRESWDRPEASRHAAYAALHCLQKDTGWHPTSHHAAVWAVSATAAASDREGVSQGEYAEQAAFLRDIFGSPFRPVAAKASWLTSTVVAITGGIYQERAFDRLPILADALMDAGCDNDDVLAHCRSDGPHVRGCWVVDLVLSRG